MSRSALLSVILRSVKGVLMKTVSSHRGSTKLQNDIGAFLHIVLQFVGFPKTAT